MVGYDYIIYFNDDGEQTKILKRDGEVETVDVGKFAFTRPDFDYNEDIDKLPTRIIGSIIFFGGKEEFEQYLGERYIYWIDELHRSSRYVKIYISIITPPDEVVVSFTNIVIYKLTGGESVYGRLKKNVLIYIYIYIYMRGRLIKNSFVLLIYLYNK